MAGIKIPIGGDLGPLREAIEKIRGHFRRLSSQIGSALRPLRAVAASVFKGMANAARAAAAQIRAVFSTLKNTLGLGGLIGGAGAGLLALGSLRAGSDLAADFERTGIALEALTGSGAEATRVLETMKATWAATGVEVAEQARTIQKFIALGFSADQAIELQGNILDIAGAIGMTASEAELLGSALAQVKAKGVVSMEELRQQIAEKGVPVFEALADRLGVTQAELMKLVENGKVPASELLAIFQNMEGSFARFRGGADRLGSTFGGMVARVRGMWRMLLADFAAPINQALKPVLQQAMDFMATLKERAVAMGKAVGDALVKTFVLIRSGRTMDLLGAGLNVAFRTAVDILFRGFQGVLAFISTALPPVMTAAFATIRDLEFWAGIKNLIVSAAYTFSSVIQEAFGRGAAAAEARTMAGSFGRLGATQVKNSGGVDFTAVLVEALKKGGQAFANQFKGESEPVARARRELRTLLDSVAKQAAALQAKTGTAPATPAAAAAAKAAGEGTRTPGMITTLQTALSRIGGGGFGMITVTPMVRQQERTNQILTRIEKKTGTGSTTAVFA